MEFHDCLGWLGFFLFDWFFWENLTEIWVTKYWFLFKNSPSNDRKVHQIPVNIKRNWVQSCLISLKAFQWKKFTFISTLLRKHEHFLAFLIKNMFQQWNESSESSRCWYPKEFLNTYAQVFQFLLNLKTKVTFSLSSSLCHNCRGKAQ